MQEETAYKEINMSILTQVASDASPRTTAVTTENTGNSPISVTTTTVTFAEIGPTATTTAYQYSATHKPVKIVRFDKTSVEMKAVRL